MLCALAFVLSLALAAAFAPAFGHLLHTTISMKTLLSPVIVATLLVLLAVVGVVSGIIPAVVASKVQPITIIRGAFVHKTKMVFSRVFIVVQNVITITMLACSLAMFAQMRHLIHAPMGFRQEGLLMVGDLSKEWEAFAEELRRLPCVKTVTPSCGTPIDGGNNYTIVDREGFKNMSIQFFVVEPAFFSVYGLRLADGSQPVPGHYYLNRKMINDIKASPKLGDPRHFTRQMPMYRVSEDAVYGGEFCDFRIRDIQQEQHPMLIYVTDKMMNRPWNLTVELTGNLEAGYKEVAKVYERVFREPRTPARDCLPQGVWCPLQPDAHAACAHLLDLCAHRLCGGLAHHLVCHERMDDPVQLSHGLVAVDRGVRHGGAPHLTGGSGRTELCGGQ